MESSRLSGQVLSVILLRESHFHIFGISDIKAYQLVLKGIDKGVGSDGKVLVLCGTSVKRNTVDGSGIVQADNVAFLDRSVSDLNLSGVLLLSFLQFFLDLFFCNFCIYFINS